MEVSLLNEKEVYIIDLIDFKLIAYLSAIIGIIYIFISIYNKINDYKQNINDIFDYYLKLNNNVCNIEENINLMNNDTITNMDNIYSKFDKLTNNIKNKNKEIDDLYVHVNVLRNKIENSDKIKLNNIINKITTYFEFFTELQSLIGEHKCKYLFGYTGQHSTSEICNTQSFKGFKGFNSVNPFEVTPVLMKYFKKYYNNNRDQFIPLNYKVWGNNKNEDSSIDSYNKTIQTQLKYFNQDSFRGRYFGIEHDGNAIHNMTNAMPHITLMNRNMTKLLTETNEEFELKILKNVLYDLEEKYVTYKKYEFFGIKHVLNFNI